MIADAIGKVYDETSIAAFYDSPNQGRTTKRARLDAPESEVFGDVEYVDPLAIRTQLLEVKEDEVIDPDEELDVVPRRQFSLMSQKLVLIVLRHRHPICCSKSRSVGAASRQLPSSPGHQEQPSMALGKIERRNVCATANRLYDCTNS